MPQKRGISNLPLNKYNTGNIKLKFSQVFPVFFVSHSRILNGLPNADQKKYLKFTTGFMLGNLTKYKK